MTAIEYLDRPLPGWFPLGLLKADDARRWDWVVQMVDIHPDILESDPTMHRPARSVWVRVPGKHRNRDAAWDALEDMLATRH
jgi:hypothetical protein